MSTYPSPWHLPFIFSAMTTEASFLHTTKIQEIITLSTATTAFKKEKQVISNDRNVQHGYNQDR